MNGRAVAGKTPAIKQFYLFYHTMRDARNARQTVRKGRKMERKKTIAVIRLHSDELKKFWQGLGGIPSGSWICLNEERDESKRQTIFLSIDIFMGA